MTEEKRKKLSYEEAEAILKPGRIVHTFRSHGWLLVGTDVSRGYALEKISKYGTEVAGTAARRLSHAIVVVDEESSPLFLETVPVDADGNSVEDACEH